MKLVVFCFYIIFAVSTGFSQTPATPAEASPTPEAVSEQDAFAAAMAVSARTDMETALIKFLEDFPGSEKTDEARSMLSTVRVNLAEEKFVAGDAAAVELFKKAVDGAPVPVTEKLFNLLGRIPGRLYFAGERVGAYDIAAALEPKISNNSEQLIALAGFYLSAEDGKKAGMLARRATELDENSVQGVLALGLAERLSFNFDKAETAFARAVELDPASAGAKRGLAEMKRAQGKYAEAVDIYNELLEADPDDINAVTGRILAGLDVGNRDAVEDELDAALEKDPQNIQLLAGAAYWYASRGHADKALDFADLALVLDARYIWAHIARARGLMLQNKPMEAEKTLLLARNYGNFPTLEYEIAAARYEAGFYREAADDLRKVFSVQNGKVAAKLGGRVEHNADDLTELIGLENKASIFISQGSAGRERAQKLKQLLELTANIDDGDPQGAAALARNFAGGPDEMKLHRHLFAAETLINRNIALGTAMELASGASRYSEAALKEPYAVSATLANELYDARREASINNRYLDQPNVPPQVLSAVIRGRIEETAGWALYSEGKMAEAAVRFNRALSVLPANSAWWRSAHWRLGSIEQGMGNDKKALDHFIRGYDISRPDIMKYVIINSLYTKVNGGNDGLEELIGPNPLAPSRAAAANIENDADDPEERTENDGEIAEEIKPAADDDKEAEAETDEADNKDEDKEVKQEPTDKEDEEEPALPEKENDKEQANKKPDPSIFEPIIIGIKPTQTEKAENDGGEKPEEADEDDPGGNARSRIIANKEVTADTGQCKILSSQENVVLRSGSGSVGILAGVEGSSAPLEIISENPEDITVSIETDPAVITSRTFFVINSISSKTGEFQIKLTAPCGERTIKVTVR